VLGRELSAAQLTSLYANLKTPRHSFVIGIEKLGSCIFDYEKLD